MDGGWAGREAREALCGTAIQASRRRTVVDDFVEVKVAKERAHKRDEARGDGAEALHHRAKLHKEQHGEGNHRDAEGDGEEEQVDPPLV